MTTTTEIFSNDQSPASHSAQASYFLAPWARIIQWIEIYRGRRQLEALSDHLLRDIGIDRSMIHSVTRDGMWR
jgi:uncharacterized protein YjiS (DUF1127 family)